MADRVLKFRTPMTCPNGHLIFQLCELTAGHLANGLVLRSKDCHCNLWGSNPLGPSEQFIDRQDVAGQDIYEGDIVTNSFERNICDDEGAVRDTESATETTTVHFDYHWLSFELHGTGALKHHGTVKIIGNIHEQEQK